MPRPCVRPSLALTGICPAGRPGAVRDASAPDGAPSAAHSAFETLCTSATAGVAPTANNTEANTNSRTTNLRTALLLSRSDVPLFFEHYGVSPRTVCSNQSQALLAVPWSSRASWTPERLSRQVPARRMVSMSKIPYRPPYPEQFRADAVALVRSSGRPAREIARELGKPRPSSRGRARPGEVLSLHRGGAGRPHFPVSLLCRVLGVSRSGFHAWFSGRLPSGSFTMPRSPSESGRSTRTAAAPTGRPGCTPTIASRAVASRASGSSG